jgi:hypothetical protein
MVKKAQMEIQQMAFMIIAVFIFFALVGVFFLSIQVNKLKGNAGELQREQAISSIRVIADMPELNYESTESMTIDEDKAIIMSGSLGKSYESFWPVSSIKLYKIYPAFDKEIKCPATNCNYYQIYDNGEAGGNYYSAFVSICSKQRESGGVYDKCEIGKLVIK